MVMGIEYKNDALVLDKLDIGVQYEMIEDPEGRSEITTDTEGKILSYRKKDGRKVESLLEVRDIIFSGNASDQLKRIIAEQNSNTAPIKKWHLPEYGTTNIVSETFYLTADNRYSDKNGVYLYQDFEDNNTNAANLVTLSNFYIKSTLKDMGDGTFEKWNDVNVNHDVKLDFYAASKVTFLDDKYYVTSTLEEIVDKETGNVTGYKVKADGTSIEVTQIVDIPHYKAWPVDKKTEHFCVVEVDFGYYLSGTFNVGVKYQGSSTLMHRKRNFRYTFYKNDKFEKKNKIKLGEMVRVSGFNLKSNMTDDTRIKEFLMNRIFMAIYDNREVNDRYPWNKENPYCGATGMIKGFPIRLNIGEEFYGIMIFGLKKDGKNYMIDEDEDGMLVGGTRNDTSNWVTATPADWEDEINDEMSQSNIDALTNFFAFINDSEQFTKANMPSRMSIKDWIDYYICLQVFVMIDNTCRNLMLYTGADKQKFYPYFYDLDLDWNFTTVDYQMLIEDAALSKDLSLWNNFKDAYWDEICNRYAELRNTILTGGYIYQLYHSIVDNIPDDDYTLESAKWGDSNKTYFIKKIDALVLRLNWLDKQLFKI